MKALLATVNNKDSFLKTLALAMFFGLMTILLVLNVDRSHVYSIWIVGTFLSGIGNDLFLILTNILIIRWAWRKRLGSIIKLTLLLDLVVGVMVHSIKLLKLEPWYLRPNGGTGGFPSGHATHAFGMAFLLTMFFPRLGWLWYSCAAAISWSRVETDWHTGFQVAVGVILGVGIAWVLSTQWLKHPDADVIKRQPVEQERDVQVRQLYAAE